MATTGSHAAEHERYEVHEVLAGEPALDLGLRFETPDFGGAVDFAFAYLERRDPGREGVVSALEIVRVTGSARETVWTYSHAQSRSVARDLVRVWGFDPARAGAARTARRRGRRPLATTRRSKRTWVPWNGPCPCVGSSSARSSRNSSRRRDATKGSRPTSSPSARPASGVRRVARAAGEAADLAAATSLAEALGLSLSSLVAAAEREAGNGGVPEIELVPVPRTRDVDRGQLAPGDRLAGATELTPAMVAGRSSSPTADSTLSTSRCEGRLETDRDSSTPSSSRRPWPTCSARASHVPRRAATCRTARSKPPICCRSARACRSSSSRPRSRRPSPPAARAGPASI